MKSPRRWNWEAALIPCWGWYRNVLIARVLSVLFPFLVAAWLRMGDVADVYDLGIASLVVWAGYGLVYGLAGDRMLQFSAPKDAGATPSSPLLLRRVLHAPLSIVLGALGLMIVVGAESNRPHMYPKAYKATMKADLRNFVTAQEAFFSDYGHYASTMDSLMFEPSPNVSVSLLRADSTSFVAEASYRDFAPRCRIFTGTDGVPGTPVDSLDGLAVCDESSNAAR